MPSAEAPGEEVLIEAGRHLFAQPCAFLAGAEKIEQLIPETLPEIAFAGRSNVGKSSLVNALTGQRTLARVSHTPGRTQQINFFDLGGRLSLVDLPGYGYAAVSKSKVSAWTKTIHLYLRGRTTLRRVCLLIDARHGLKALDEEIMDLLDQSAVQYSVVLTKADKVKSGPLAEVIATTESRLKSHPAAFPQATITSAHKGIGVPDLRADLAQLATPVSNA